MTRRIRPLAGQIREDEPEYLFIPVGEAEFAGELGEPKFAEEHGDTDVELGMMDMDIDQDTFETLRAAALVGKATWPDQIDYYDPDRDEIV